MITFQSSREALQYWAFPHCSAEKVCFYLLVTLAQQAKRHSTIMTETGNNAKAKQFGRQSCYNLQIINASQ